MGHATAEYKYADLTRRVIKVFYEVYNEIGFGYLEAICEEAMAIALAEEGLAFERQQSREVWFRGRQIGLFKPDLVVNTLVLVELKSVTTIESAHEAQVLNYLRATSLEVALLLNFGAKPQVRRLVFDNSRKRSDNSRPNRQFSPNLR